MNAVLLDAYGASDRLQVREVPTPDPAPGQVRIRVRATSVNPIDWKTRKGQLRPILRLELPTILGVDAAGEVDAVGPGVDRFQPGDRVYTMLDPRRGRGGYAQFTVADASGVAAMPSGLSFEEAAAFPCAALTALQALRDLGGLAPGRTALVNGAAGGVGTFAVQIARALGGTVAGVCGPSNLDFVRAFGVDPVIDYTREDFTRRPERFDVVLDAVARSSFGSCARILRPGGTYVTTLPSPGILAWSVLGPILGLFGRPKRARMVMAKPVAADLETLARYVEERKVRPVIDRVLPLEKLPQAHDVSETGHVRGKIVIRVD